MAGKPNNKWMQTMVKKHGSREAVRKHLQEIGASGGKKSRGGGFASDRELARKAGAIGGRKSKRGKSKKES